MPSLPSTELKVSPVLEKLGMISRPFVVPRAHPRVVLLFCACEAHAHEVHAHEMYACEIHVYKVHVYEVHAREMHAYEMHANEMHAHGVHAYVVYPYEIPTREMHACETPAHEMHTRESIPVRYTPTVVWLFGGYGGVDVVKGCPGTNMPTTMTSTRFKDNEHLQPSPRTNAAVLCTIWGFWWSLAVSHFSFWR